MRNYDLDFLKKFSLVIGFLVVVTLGLILFSRYLHGTFGEPDPAAATRQQARAHPWRRVCRRDGAASQAAAMAAAAAKATSQSAYGGTLDGAVVYQNLCAGCHTSGAGGAPKLDAAGMGARASKGMDLLNQHAIEGFTGTAGVMPAKGGNPALTDEQVIATVEWMMGNLE